MRKKYLNNRDLLKEIANSKNTYCSYVDPDREPKNGEKAVFPIEGMLAVGVFERGLRTSRLLFDNPAEQPENVKASDCLGVVVMSMMSDFLKSLQ